jgi:hypothetical protein
VVKFAWNGASVLARAAGGANASRLTVASRSASDARCRRLEDLKWVLVFILLIPFILFLGFVALARVNPKTQAVSHFFPKVCAPLQRK